MDSKGNILIVDDEADLASVRFVRKKDQPDLEQGKIAFKYEQSSMETIIEGIIYELKTVINEKKLYVRFDHMQLDSLPPVWVDRDRVNGALLGVEVVRAHQELAAGDPDHSFGSRTGRLFRTEFRRRSIEEVHSDRPRRKNRGVRGNTPP